MTCGGDGGRCRQEEWLSVPAVGSTLSVVNGLAITRRRDLGAVLLDPTFMGSLGVRSFMTGRHFTGNHMYPLYNYVRIIHGNRHGSNARQCMYGSYNGSFIVTAGSVISNAEGSLSI